MDNVTTSRAPDFSGFDLGREMYIAAAHKPSMFQVKRG
jgi:hypothetical protein